MSKSKWPISIQSCPNTLVQKNNKVVMRYHHFTPTSEENIKITENINIITGGYVK